MTTFLRRVVWPAFALLVVLTLITGVAYPALVTAVAQVGFNHQANGSLIVAKDGRTVGSSLIGQAFTDDKYFWGRLSAAGVTDENPDGYDASGSAGSNLGPTNQDLIDRVNQSVADYQAANGRCPDPGRPHHDVGVGPGSRHQPRRGRVPGRASGEARAASSEDAVRGVVARHTEQPLLGFLGKPRVNVLELNLDLDGLIQ